MGSESLHSPTKYLMSFLHQLYSHADFITENYAAVLKKKVFIPSLSNSTYCTIVQYNTG